MSCFILRRTRPSSFIRFTSNLVSRYSSLQWWKVIKRFCKSQRAWPVHGIFGSVQEITVTSGCKVQSAQNFMFDESHPEHVCTAILTCGQIATWWHLERSCFYPFTASSKRLITFSFDVHTFKLCRYIEPVKMYKRASWTQTLNLPGRQPFRILCEILSDFSPFSCSVF